MAGHSFCLVSVYLSYWIVVSIINIFTLLDINESSVADYQARLMRRKYIIVYLMVNFSYWIFASIHESVTVIGMNILLPHVR